MRNNHPKSEGPAMREHAAMDKELVARQKTTAAEKAVHASHAERPRTEAKPKSKSAK